MVNDVILRQQMSTLRPSLKIYTILGLPSKLHSASVDKSSKPICILRLFDSLRWTHLSYSPTVSYPVLNTTTACSRKRILSSLGVRLDDIVTILLLLLIIIIVRLVLSVLCNSQYQLIVEHYDRLFILYSTSNLLLISNKYNDYEDVVPVCVRLGYGLRYSLPPQPVIRNIVCAYVLSLILRLKLIRASFGLAYSVDPLIKPEKIHTIHNCSIKITSRFANAIYRHLKYSVFLDSERSDECIDFTMIITSRNNAPISNYGVVSDVKFKFLRNLSKTRKFAKYTSH
ncbi:hypothetical protein AGLY_011632 [Aphis glycines]|uniref:Uncharacterized protein n=1 Tax=Aphis glycines TaxID=307491 RepID=A0A6G0TAR8_APHGL|nr:hypothetical protein AGLY_011632 [Aphis glycines]